VSRFRDKAQNVVEYGLLIGTIVVVVLLGVGKCGSPIEPWFAALAGHIITVGHLKFAVLMLERNHAQPQEFRWPVCLRCR
jgi:Flp pilus assembly pilin Flp